MWGQAALLGSLFSLSFLCTVALNDININPGPPQTVVQPGVGKVLFRLMPWPPPVGRQYAEYIELKYYNSSNNALLCKQLFVNGTSDTTANPGWKWCQHGRFDIQGTNLIISKTSVPDSGAYKLEIEYNRGAKRGQANMDLTVEAAPGPPTLSQRENPVLEVDQSFNFTCTSIGANPPARLTLFRDDVRQDMKCLLGATWRDRTVCWTYLRAISRHDHGKTYSCAAQNRVNALAPVSSSISLSVRHKPFINLMPCKQDRHPHVVLEGWDVRLSCVMSAYPPITNRHWFKNGVQLAEDGDYLEVFDVKALHNYTYSCRAQNTLGVGETTCPIDVQYGAVVSVPSNYTTYEFGRVNVTCTAHGNPMPTSFRWIREGHPDFVQEGQVLLINKVTPEHAGMYTCEATNLLTPSNRQPREWTGRASMKLIVEFQPRPVDYLIKKFTGITNKPSILACKVRAYPHPTFTWKYGGIEIVQDTRRKISSSGLESNLSISPTFEVDFGKGYVCEAKHKLAKVDINMKLMKPGIPDAPSACQIANVSARYVIFRCLAGYDGGEQVSFVAEKSTDRYLPQRVPCETQWLGTRLALLTVKEVEPNKNYTITLYGKNIHGRSEESVAYFVRTPDGPPLPPSGPYAAAIAGGCVAGVVGVALIIIIIILLLRRRHAEPRRKPTKPKCSIEEQQCRSASSEQLTEGATGGAKPNKNTRKTDGHENVAFKDEPLRRQPSIPNEYINPQEARRQQRPVLNLHHSIGESSDSAYDNGGYTKETMETELGASPGGAKYPRKSAQYGDKDRWSPGPYSGYEPYQGQRSPSRKGEYDQLQKPTRPSVNGRSEPEVERRRTSSARDSGVACRPLSGMGDLTAGAGWSQRPLSGIGAPAGAQGLGSMASMGRGRDSYEFPREKLYVRHKLGEGSFGEVWRATAVGLGGKTGQTVVAVKMLRDDAPAEETRAIMRELETMKSLRPHPNVIHLLGWCTLSGPVYIIMEYAAKGNLQQFLRDNRNNGDSPYANLHARSRTLTSRDLTIFALHVASGMAYISSKELLHRDLAARNVLVDSNLTCKISDFGFARDVVHSRQYESKTQRRMPLRWMAPESLFDCIYTTKSDVWAFGVLLWEIVTLGSSPYPGMSGPDVMDLIQMGHRMDKPRHCSERMYQMMRDCWRPRPERRPDFRDICDSLGYLLDEPESNMGLEDMEENQYEILENPPGEKC